MGTLPVAMPETAPDAEDTDPELSEGEPDFLKVQREDGQVGGPGPVTPGAAGGGEGRRPPTPRHQARALAAVQSPLPPPPLPLHCRQVMPVV